MIKGRRGLYGYQYFFISVLLLAAGVHAPGLVRGAAGTGAFGAFLIAAAAGVPLTLLYAAVFGKRGGLHAGYAEAFGDRAAGVPSVLSALYILYCGAETLSLLRLYLDVSSYVPPSAAVLVLCAAGAALAAMGDSATAGRTAVILAGAAALSLPVIAVSVISRGSAKNILPLFSAPPRTLLLVSLYLISSVYAQTLMTAPLCAGLTEKRGIMRASAAAAAAGGAAVLLSALFMLMTDGQTASAAGTVYRISYTGASGFRGLKAASAVLMFITAVFKTAVSIRAASVCIGDAFKIKKRRLLPLFAGAAVFLTQLVFPRDTAGLAAYLLQYSFYVPALPAVVLPAAAGVMQIIKRRPTVKNGERRMEKRRTTRR